MYKVGDIVMSIAPRGHYYITSRYCIAKVIDIWSNEEIVVEVIKCGCEIPERDKERYIGEEYEVSPKYFVPFAINKGEKEDKNYV